MALVVAYLYTTVPSDKQSFVSPFVKSTVQRPSGHRIFFRPLPNLRDEGREGVITSVMSKEMFVWGQRQESRTIVPSLRTSTTLCN